MSVELSLYKVEEEYFAYLDTEELVGPEQEQEFQVKLQDALERRDEKREGVAHFLRFLSLQQEDLDKEIDRLRERKKMFLRAEDRLYGYIANVIKMVPPDSQGKYRKLQTATVTMFLRALPTSVEVNDEELVPPEYKRVSVSMPLDLWMRLYAQEPELQMHETLGIQVGHITVDRELVRKTLENGGKVPGADLLLKGHDHTLVVK